MTNHSSSPLKGKVALVTGGSRGIGAGIALRLAHDGATVAITYSNSATRADEIVKEIESAGGRALGIKADSGDRPSVEAAISETVSQLGSLDILVNNAGIAVLKPIDELSVEDFDRQMAVNVRGVFVAVKAALPHLKEGSRIINIGSINAESAPFVGASIYATSKAALAGLTRGLARDLGARGISVSNVQPGPVHTELNPENSEFADSIKKLMAIPRYAQASEIAALVSYLAGPEGGFVTGSSLTIDGGFDA